MEPTEMIKGRMYTHLNRKDSRYVFIFDSLNNYGNVVTLHEYIYYYGGEDNGIWRSSGPSDNMLKPDSSTIRECLEEEISKFVEMTGVAYHPENSLYQIFN